MNRRLVIWLGAIASAIAPLVVHFGIVSGRAHFTFDYDGYHFPIASALYERFPMIAQWDPFTLGGSALSSNLQAAFFHPPQVAVFIANALASNEALSPGALAWVNLINFVVLAVGCYALTLFLTGSVGAGLLAATLVTASGSVLSQSQHMGVIGAISVTPWLVLIILGTVRATRTSDFVLLGIALSTTFAYSFSAGFPPQFVSVVILCGVVVAASFFIGRSRPVSRIVTFLTALAGALVLSLGPVLAYALAPEMGLQVSQKPAVALDQLLTVISPNAYGTMEWPEMGWSVDPTTHFAWGGFAFLPLLIATLIVRATVTVRILLGAGGTLIAVAMSPLLPVVSGLGKVFEVVRPFNLIAPAMIVLCCVAASSWAYRGSLVKKRRIVYTAGLVLTAGACSLLFALRPAFFSVEPALFLLAVSLCIGLGLSYGHLPRIAALGLMALICLESTLIVGSARFIQVENEPNYEILAPLDDNELLVLLQSRPGFTAADSEFLGGEWNGWWPVWHVPSVSGFQPTFSAEWERAAQAASTWRDDRRFNFGRFESGLPAALGVDTYITPSVRLPEVLSRVEGSTLLYDKAGYAVVALPGAAPEASLVDTAGTSIALTLSRPTPESMIVQVPCVLGRGASLRIIGAMDSRWVLTTDQRSGITGVVRNGVTSWDLDSGECGTLNAQFTDKGFDTGNLISLCFLVILTLAAGTAYRIRRRDLGSKLVNRSETRALEKSDT